MMTAGKKKMICMFFNRRKVMSNLSALLNDMGNYSAASITMGEIKGVIAKLPLENQTDFSFGIKTTGDMNVCSLP